VVVGVAFFAGDTFAVGSTAIQRASPDELSNATRNDEFYSSSRESTLLVRGTVASVRRTGPHAIITFATESRFGASCAANQAAATLQRGATIAVLAEGYQAVRLKSAVGLVDCVILNSKAR
jgi:hypothetical protein